MTKNEMIMLLKTHVGKKADLGNEYYGFLLEEGYAKTILPSIYEYWTFSEKEAQLIEEIANNDELKKLWDSSEYDEFEEDIDLDNIHFGLEIYEEFQRILPNHDYYTFSDDSEEFFESFEDAESALNERVEEFGYLEITPFEDLDEDELEDIISDFEIDTEES